jgi:radical SAM protein with 4Fe4S-binding SPASM domain
MEPRVRFEAFGGILGLDEPPALVFVDRAYLRELGHAESPLWQQARTHLTAPTEVHFNLTRRCTLACRHCTSQSGPGASAELSNEQARRALQVMSGMGVFHVAFGGGELFLRSDAIELASHARQLGMVPNATTNGHCMTAELARACTVFGQVNVSLDGVGPRYGILRGAGEFQAADRALRQLVQAGVRTGINCVLTRDNFDDLQEVVAYADGLGLHEVLLLRLKPSGRARQLYHQHALTAEQGRALMPSLKRLSKRFRTPLQTDCSFVPHLCAHRPSKRAMAMLGVEGCSGGDMLLGVDAEGALNACSHHGQWVGHVSALPSLWDTHEHFRTFRQRRVQDPRCLSCRYLNLCRGGCPLFSEFLTGDFNAADPECPVLQRGA